MEFEIALTESKWKYFQMIPVISGVLQLPHKHVVYFVLIWIEILSSYELKKITLYITIKVWKDRLEILIQASYTIPFHGLSKIFTHLSKVTLSNG